ncbi:hypothetical protein [Pseudomonas aeruginosa]|uniref:hypothetical protein n=1 Tax=Pseudomonas aeruginosa TaxID=287 RepID=UPI0015D4DFDF|nr:hypothetical protein [Pseudomonas aeruginosa]EJO5057999.1 hypothetical protein [Pseudomonas aeruginosa]NYU58334.1 hypothetical protein [Pseudomonas aeruginosa]
MSEVCAKHVKTPAFIYGACIGCELEGLRAEAQALREEVAKLTQYNKSLDEENTRLLADCEKTDREVAALRARVAVVPERKLLNAGVPGLNRNSGWNACLDELARLNGLTVSEGLLRRVCAEQPATCCMDDEMSWRRDRDSALIELRALLSEQE